ncbi:LysR family transcriptional regulator [Achromobacter aloeverae]|uniref:LysR family transcriptional regulator n=1 Tax=Achromobacter aloeverae TaxID=1750518 RepID=A0A4Q1HNM7_9BURK|nr:LysR family transcriptional regulator [Achromobacter aloeverae]RXN91602.1 LysR family transcriptional regulator [Achromobacter aloeverae]
MLNTAFRYFLEVVNAGSLTGAALRLHVAPSAVSRMIRKIEDEYDIALFERHGRGMVLTEAGEILATSAKRSQLEAELARTDIGDLRKVGQRLIRISANQAFGMELLPTLMARFQNATPEVTFNLTLLRASEIHRRVQDGEDDIGLYYSLKPAVDVNLQYTRRMRVLALVKQGHPLTARDSVSLKDIASYPVGHMSQGTTIRAIVDLCCMQKNVALTTAFVSNNVTALQNFCLVRENAVVFFGELTATSVLKHHGLVALPIADAQLHQRHLQIITMEGRELPVSARRFLAMIIQHIEEEVGPPWVAPDERT